MHSETIYILQIGKIQYIYLISIVNESIETGEMPGCLKRSLVTPLLKKASADPNVPNNYRPVSNLFFLSKVIEKVIAKRLKEHLGN
jgi:hypothetical protein